MEPINPDDRGFTLMEVVVAAAIMAIIAAAGAAFMAYMSRSSASLLRRGESNELIQDVLKEFQLAFSQRLVPRAGEVDIIPMASAGFVGGGCGDVELRARARIRSIATGNITEGINRTIFRTTCVALNRPTVGAKRVHEFSACDQNGTSSQVTIQRILANGQVINRVYSNTPQLTGVGLCIRVNAQQLIVEAGSVYLTGQAGDTPYWGFISDKVTLNRQSRSAGIELLPPPISGP